MRFNQLKLKWVLGFVLVAFPCQADFGADVEQKYNSLKSWSADFVQTTHIEMLSETVSKTGLIQVSRPNQMRITYDYDDDKKIYVSNGKKLWIYKEKETVAYLFKKPKKMISREALSFLSGLKDLSKIFDVLPDLNEADGPLQIKDKRLKKLFLVPKELGTSVLRITLGVNPQSLRVQEALLINASGNQTHYQFKKIAFNPELKEALFVLPKEPERKIIKK